METKEIKQRFRQLVIQRAVDNGWSFKEEENAMLFCANTEV